MDWWDELWLNEGFATWVGWLAVDHFYPGKEIYIPFQRSQVKLSNTMVEWNIWSQFVVRTSSGDSMFQV
jgi:aminopeptidase N